MSKDYKTGFSVPLYRGPFQNNGASPWFARVGFGTSAQSLKICFDTGSDFNWVTSSLCVSDTCHHYGGEQFNFQASNTFRWLSQEPQSVSFGPWGTMEVEAGQDIVRLQPLSPASEIDLISDLYLAQSYSSRHFAELDWDGGIGLPSVVPHSAEVGDSTEQAASFHFFESLIQQGKVNPDSPFVGFLTDIPERQGRLEFGLLNQAYRDSREYLFLPWQEYQANYLWTTPLLSLSMGGKHLLEAKDGFFFALDSGSSQFKGDENLMNSLLLLAMDKETLSIQIGETDKGEAGEITVDSTLYDVLIEEGQYKGQVISQFDPMEGADDIALVGSIIMDHLYTLYQYKAELVDKVWQLKPLGVWVFNKPDGPKIITSRQSKRASLFDA